MNQELQFFIFIDAENISYNLVEPVFDEILKYGMVSGKRAYADWSNPAYKNWPGVLDKFGIRPYQQFHYDTDETDKAIIMDIMEVVYSSGNINGICLIGNDHIYGSVARRVRERGLYFLGIGTSIAATKFVDSCNSFIYLDNISADAEDEEKSLGAVSGHKDVIGVLRLILKAMEETDDETVPLASLANTLKKLDPAFDSRTYGYKKFIDLVRSFGDILAVEPNDRIPPVYYVRKV